MRPCAGRRSRRGLGAAAALIALAVLPSPAFGQATRTWISGVGDDANPCSRTAPCKTFAGAISKTASGGEIDALDQAPAGAVTITKSITLRGRGVIAGILTSGTNGVLINTSSVNDRVNLIGLNINGLLNSPDGVRVLQAGVVTIRNTDIYNFTFAGVDFRPVNANAKLTIHNSEIFNIYNAGYTTGSGVVVEPTGSGAGKATIRNSEIDNNAYGLVASGASNAASITATDSSITNSAGIGVLSNGAQAVVRIARNDFFGNATGLLAGNSAQILSFSDNAFADNGVDGSATGTITRK
jgi:hypothetical protein